MAGMIGSMSKADEYADALADLDRWRASGQISPAKYDVLRAKLLRDAAKPPLLWWHKVVGVVALLALLWLLTQVVRVGVWG